MRKFLTDYRRALANWIAGATVVILLGAGIFFGGKWYLSYQWEQTKQHAVEKVKAGKDAVLDTARRAKDASIDAAEKAGKKAGETARTTTEALKERWRHWRNSDKKDESKE